MCSLGEDGLGSIGESEAKGNVLDEAADMWLADETETGLTA